MIAHTDHTVTVHAWVGDTQVAQGESVKWGGPIPESDLAYFAIPADLGVFGSTIDVAVSFSELAAFVHAVEATR